MRRTTRLGREPCIYRLACGDCDGLPEAHSVHLRSGEIQNIGRLKEIELTPSELIFSLAGGSSIRLPRSEVFFVGCSRCSPPILT